MHAGERFQSRFQVGIEQIGSHHLQRFAVDGIRDDFVLHGLGGRQAAEQFTIDGKLVEIDIRQMILAGQRLVDFGLAE